MTAQEFDYQFDVLYNNITSNQAPGLDSYEKSVFLTKAQDEIIKNYFLRQSNPKQAGFDNNQKRQADFSNIIIVAQATNPIAAKYAFQSNAKNFTLPTTNKILLILNEKVGLSNDRNLVVKSVALDEYDRLVTKPFKYPTKNQAWRLITSPGTVDIVVGPNDTISNYTIRYVKKPHPIIVDVLETGLTVDGYTFVNTTTPNPPVSNVVYKDKPCELDEILHEEILQRAVELAKISWANGNDNTQLLVQAGSRSE